MMVIIPGPTTPSSDAETVADVLQEFLSSPEGRGIREAIDPGKKVELFAWKKKGRLGQIWAKCFYTNGWFEVESNIEYGNSSLMETSSRPELSLVVEYLTVFGEVPFDQVVSFVRSRLEKAAA